MKKTDYRKMRRILWIIYISLFLVVIAFNTLVKGATELAAIALAVRILQYHKIYVFKVYCKNCGAEYTMTSEDDYICQYCGHRVIRKNAE